MKKLIPFLVSSVLVVGAVGCNSDTKTSETTTTPGSTAVKEAGQKTESTATKITEKTGTAIKEAAGGGVKTIIKNKLDKQFPGSNLQVSQKDDVLTVSGTVPDQATFDKIAPAVKEYKLQGFKTVKVEAKVAAKKAQ
jgi:hyperosmotically inducible periplasmic protein